MVEEGDERMKIRISGQKKVAGYSGERRGRRKMKEKKRKRRSEKNVGIWKRRKNGGTCGCAVVAD